MSERTFEELAATNEACVQPDKHLRRCYAEIFRLRAHAARLEGEVERLTTALKAVALTTAVCGKCGGQRVDALVVGMERARAARLEERLGVVRGVLKSVEWGVHVMALASGEVAECCPECNNYKMHGHAPDCALAAALGEG